MKRLLLLIILPMLTLPIDPDDEEQDTTNKVIADLEKRYGHKPNKKEKPLFATWLKATRARL